MKVETYSGLMDIAIVMAADDGVAVVMVVMMVMMVIMVVVMVVIMVMMVVVVMVVMMVMMVVVMTMMVMMVMVVMVVMMVMVVVLMVMMVIMVVVMVMMVRVVVVMVVMVMVVIMVMIVVMVVMVMVVMVTKKTSTRMVTAANTVVPMSRILMILIMINIRGRLSVILSRGPFFGKRVHENEKSGRRQGLIRGNAAQAVCKPHCLPCCMPGVKLRRLRALLFQQHFHSLNINSLRPIQRGDHSCQIHHELQALVG